MHGHRSVPRPSIFGHGVARWRRVDRGIPPNLGPGMQRIETRMLFRASDREGKLAGMRVEVIRKTNALYHGALGEKQGDDWKDLAGHDYQRK